MNTKQKLSSSFILVIVVSPFLAISSVMSSVLAISIVLPVVHFSTGYLMAVVCERLE